MQLLAIIRIVEELSGAEENLDSIDTSLITSNGTSDHSRPDSETRRHSLQILGDRTHQKSLARIQEWRKIIARTERKRLRKLFQDL
jgi:hypothetical protein